MSLAGSKKDLFLIAVLFAVCASVSTVFASSQSTSNGGGQLPKSPYEYTPITALNQYGQSIQMSHARLASARRGTLTLVAEAVSVSNNEDGGDADDVVNSGSPVLVCCELRRWSSSSSTRQLQQRRARPSLAMISRCPPLAVLGTGFRPDLVYLVEKLRDYARRIWERFDTAAPTASHLARAASQVCTAFLGYDTNDEIEAVASGVGPVLVDPKDEDVMDRPLGLEVWVLGIGTDGSGADVCAVDATGRVRRIQGCAAMGANGNSAGALLERRWKPGMTEPEARALLLEVVREVHEKNEKDNRRNRLNDTETKFTVKFETLSHRGIKIKVIPL